MLEGTPGDRSVGRDRPRRRAGLLARLALLCCVLLLGASWSLASAPASSPDDDFHLASIWCAWGTEATGCEILAVPPSREPLAVSVPALSQHISSCMAFHPDNSGSCIGELADPWPSRANNGSYPDGYYAAQRLLASDSVTTSLVLMRLAGFVACLALMIGSAALLRHDDRWRTLLHWWVASVPLGMFVFASSNPSGVAVAGVAAAFAAAYAAMSATRTHRTWESTLVACLAIAAACLSRPDAALYCGIAVAAAGLAAEAWRPARRRTALVVALPLGVLLGAVLAVRDSAVAGALASSPDRPGPSVMRNLVRLPLLYVGDFATTLGWLDTHMPTIAWASVALALVVLALLGMRGLWAGRVAGLVLVGCAAIALPLVMLDRLAAVVGTEVQPRYLLPLVMTAAGLLALRLERHGPEPWRLPWIVAAGLASLANSLALHTTLRRYVTGLDVRSWNLDAAPEWWWDIPIGPMGVWAIGSASFAVVALTLALLVSSRPDEVRGPGLDRALATMG